MKRLFFVIFTTLIVASISLVDNASAKVFAPYNSPVFHTKDCKRLPSNIRLMEFPSVQAAINSGASACPHCIRQTSPSLTNQSQMSTTIPKTKIVPQKPTGTEDEISYMLYCDKVTGECFDPNHIKTGSIESFGDRDWKSNDYEKVFINVEPVDLYRGLIIIADMATKSSEVNPDIDAPITFEGKPVFKGGQWIDDEIGTEVTIVFKSYGFFKQTERHPNDVKKSEYTGYGLSKSDIVFKHGKFESWYENGLPKIKSDIKYNYTDGRAIVWHENGKIMYDTQFQHGKQHGIQKTYDQKGNLIYKDTYKNGDKINRKAFDNEGRLKFDTDY